MEQKKYFRCHSCGACCMALGDILAIPLEDVEAEFRQEVADFPYKADDNGTCEKLGEDMKCTIYDNRPTLCKVDAHYGRLDTKQTKEEYYAETEMACKYLMAEKLGMSEKKIEEIYASL